MEGEGTGIAGSHGKKPRRRRSNREMTVGQTPRPQPPTERKGPLEVVHTRRGRTVQSLRDQGLQQP
jgi:hypothetical protein